MLYVRTRRQQSDMVEMLLDSTLDSVDLAEAESFAWRRLRLDGKNGPVGHAFGSRW